MQDGDHDALHLPILGDTSTGAHSGDANNKLLVVATLAAIFLAGSAIVYRTRPLYSLTGLTSSASGKKDAAQKSQKVKVVESSRGGEKGTEREEGGSNASAFETGTGAYDENGSLLVPGSPTRTADDYDTKESKSSRSKDRRRRGKDPLKEILKSEKKSRGLGSPTISAKDPSFATSPAGKDHSTPSSPMASLFSDSHLTRIDNGKNGRTKRAAQREKSNIGPDGTTSQARGSAAETTSVTHSRGPSESISASENLQRQHLFHRVGSPSSSSTSSQTLPTANYHHHPYSSQHNRPPSSLASDDGFGRPMSSMSMSTTSSAASGHVNNVDHQDEVSEWDNNNSDAFSKDRPNRASQARQLRFARKDDEDEHLHHASIINDNINRAADSSPFPSSISTTATSLITSSYPASNSNSTSRSTSSSVSVSASTETTTAPASMSSSLVLSTGGMTPATSPTLSHDSVSSKTILTLKGGVQDETDVGVPHDKRVGPSFSPSNSLASSSNSVDTAGASSTKRKKYRKASQQTTTTTMSKGESHNPWDWDGAGDAPSSSSSYLVEGDNDADNDKAKDKETYQKPPRLQQSGVATAKGPSFSTVATSRLPSSSTHPTSLYSPTTPSFGQSISGSGLTGSLSAAPGGVSTSGTSPSLGSDSGFTSGELRERYEDEAFTFPTLNPTTTTTIAGPSRMRSSLADINNNNINNINTTYNISHNSSSTSRRAPTPRRPPTPSRSNSNSTPPPHPSSSSSSSPHLGHSNLVNSPTSHPGSANGNSMPALSTQTQLASLRGALEAARLREEKNKQEMERYVKEMEILKWENVNCRRGEVELQTHIRHLMHQLQTYAALFASVAPQLQQQQQQANGTAGAANPVNAGPSTSTSAAPNGYGPTTGSNFVPATPQASSSVSSPTLQQPQTPSTHPHPPPPPLHIQQMLSNMQMNGLLSPGGVLSPLSMSTPPVMNMHPGASASFFPYVIPPHQHTPPHPLMVHAQQMQFMQQQQGSAQPSSHQANIFSSIFPPGPPPLMSPHQQHQYSAYVASQQAVASASTSSAAANPYGSGPSSIAGTSSGSLSPDLTGSPTPGAGGLNGKRRARTRTQTAGGGPGSRAAWEDVGDGWVGVGGPEESDAVEEPVKGEQAIARDGVEGEDDDEYSEGGFNSVLADAILKRPASIRVRSTSRRGKLNMEKENGKLEGDAQGEGSVLPTEKPEPEQLTEFMFPSLSNLGNVNYKSDVIAVNGGLSSSSSSSMASPALLPAVDAVGDLIDTVSNEQPLSEVEPIPTDSNDITDLAKEDVEDVLSEALETSNSESDTTPRKEVPETNLTQPSTEPTNMEHEQDLKQTQGTEETNGLPVEQ